MSVCNCLSVARVRLSSAVSKVPRCLPACPALQQQARMTQAAASARSMWPRGWTDKISRNGLGRHRQDPEFGTYCNKGSLQHATKVSCRGGTSTRRR